MPGLVERVTQRNGTLVWRANDVTLLVKGATAEGLQVAAGRVQQQAQANVEENDQIDTGMMQAAIYYNGQAGGNYAEARRLAAARAEQPGRKSGQLNDPDRIGAEENPPADGMTAVVVAGADYSIYQEERQSFLYKALEQVGRDVGGIIQVAARRKGL